MASHDLINTKATILGATLGAMPGIAANPPERFSFAPAFSERFFKNWGDPRAPEMSHLEFFFGGGGAFFLSVPMIGMDVTANKNPSRPKLLLINLKPIL